jgi:hypothetical protein
MKNTAIIYARGSSLISRKVMYMCRAAIDARDQDFAYVLELSSPSEKRRSSSLVEMGPAKREKRKKTKNPRRHPFSSGQFVIFILPRFARKKTAFQNALERRGAACPQRSIRKAVLPSSNFLAGRYMMSRENKTLERE